MAVIRQEQVIDEPLRVSDINRYLPAKRGNAGYAREEVANWQDVRPAVDCFLKQTFLIVLNAIFR